MPTARAYFGVAVIDGILYVAGGSHQSGILATVEAYDPATDTWTTKASMPTERVFLAAGAVNGILYAVGGYNDTNLDLTTVEAFTPALPAAMTLQAPSLSQTYDGTPKSASFTTTPADLSGVLLTYDGSSTAPTNAGSYAVVAHLTNANYTASDATGTLVIHPATPAIVWNPPASIAYGTGLSGTQLNAAAKGVGGGSLDGRFTYAPGAGTVLGLGTQTLSVSFTPTDLTNYTNATHNVQIAVLYPFTGFFKPVANPTVVNSVKAGRAVPVKFSLGGDRGLDIFATGFAASRSYTCTQGSEDGGVEQTVAAGSSTLSYDATTEQYTYVWKTDRLWAGTCWRLLVGLKDGSVHEALFRFTK